MSSVNQHTLSRRGFCICCVGGSRLRRQEWLAKPFASLRRGAQHRRSHSRRRRQGTDKDPQAAPQRQRPRGLRRQYRLSLTGADGKVFIDGGITASRPRILEAANSLSRGPIKHLINTHWHFDHADGNAWLNAQGAAIHRPRKHPQASLVRPESRRLGFQLPLAGTRSRSDGSVRVREGSDPERLHGLPSNITVPLTRTAIYRLHSRSGYSSLRRHLLERNLSVHRLLDRREHRRDDQGGRGQCRRRDRPDDRDSRPWPAGEQQGGTYGLSRYARRDPRECREAQAAGPLARRHHRRQADRGVRREVGSIRHRPRRSSPAWFTRACDALRSGVQAADASASSRTR